MSNNTTILEQVKLDPDGAATIPFFILMLVMAFTPLTPLEKIWSHHYVKVVTVLAFSLPIWIYYGVSLGPAGVEAMVTQLIDWINFVCLIGSLYVVAGGVYFDYDQVAQPWFNTLFLGCGALLANITGTTGACMILIRVFIHRNKPRLAHHHIVFFIMLIGNIGGVLTPLGDPPMFIGFLKGIPFLWMLSTPTLIGGWIFCVVSLLGMFFFWDTRNYQQYLKSMTNNNTKIKNEITTTTTLATSIMTNDDKSNQTTVTGNEEQQQQQPNVIDTEETLEEIHEELEEEKGTGAKLIFKGQKSLGGFVIVILIVIIQGLPIYGPNTERTVQLIASALQVTFAFTLHYFIEDPEVYKLNKFSFGPVIEVIILFFGLFMTLAPVLGYLEFHAYELGINTPWKFFWITGALSAVLDNAPTYLTFAGLAAGQFNSSSFNDPADVTYLINNSPEFNKMMEAISMGAVFFGAMTYLGNAPNLMVKGTVEAMIHKAHGHGYPKNAVPNFLIYMAWVVPTLTPLFIVVTFIIGGAS
jgi:Na+/H+ antiporter NhaD/arsenite permease-like protein